MQRDRNGQKTMFYRPYSGDTVFGGGSENHRDAFSGNLAALRAGRRLADPREVEAAVLRAGLDYLTSPQGPSDSARMRTVVVPFLAAAVAL